MRSPNFSNSIDAHHFADIWRVDLDPRAVQAATDGLVHGGLPRRFVRGSRARACGGARSPGARRKLDARDRVQARGCLEDAGEERRSPPRPRRRAACRNRSRPPRRSHRIAGRETSCSRYSVRISSFDSSFSSESARKTSRSLRRNCFSFVIRTWCAPAAGSSCCRPATPPWSSRPARTARAMPCQSTPGCSKKRSSSAASTACTTTGGICSQVTGTRRCSPI